MPSVKQISVLGSTGSIGESTLDVISRQSGRYSVFALCAHKSTTKLYTQCLRFRPRYAVLTDVHAAAELRRQISQTDVSTEVLAGSAALDEVAADPAVDIVMAGIVGAAGLASTLTAIEAGKKVLIANKEPIVMAGDFMLERARQSGAKVVPVDSEHNAIMQCMGDHYCVVSNNSCDGVNRILLTGSGGPFRTLPLERFPEITPAQACAHPNWQMGKKISVDSATMMNKALELIEACILFGQNHSKVEILIHPQSVIHSMVEYVDGSVIAQMGSPDMRIPIASALAWPERIDSGAKKLDFQRLSALEFEPPDLKRYPSLDVVSQVIRAAGTAPAIMNAANEVAVKAFLQERIKFTQILDLVKKTLDSSSIDSNCDLEGVINADQQARIKANQFIA